MLRRQRLTEERAWRSARNGQGPWWNSGASHMNAAFPKRFFDALGLISLLDTQRRLQPDAPHWERVIAWLHEKMPIDHPRPAIVHNDYRFDNVILDADNPMRIIGVLDWEMTTLGDPLMDLGNSLAYWIEANDPPPVQLMRHQPSNAPGMLTRRQFVEYYAERAGISLDNFDYYYCYGLFRLAGIIQQIYYRFHHGQTQDKRFVQFIHMNRLLEQMTLQVVGKSSL